MLPNAATTVETSCGNLNLSMMHLNNAINELKLACETMNNAAGEHAQYVFQPIYRKFQYGMPSGASLDNVRDEIALKMTSSAWIHLISKIKMNYLMTDSEYNEFKANVINNPPVFTPEAVSNLFLSLVDNREERAINGLVDMFESLCDKFKRHNPFSISMRIILKDVCKQGFNSPESNVLYVSPFADGSLRLRDLERAVNLILRPNKTFSTEDDILEKLKQHLLSNPDAAYEDSLFSIKLCKNGNAHITFVNRQVVEQLNDKISQRYPFHLPG